MGFPHLQWFPKWDKDAKLPADSRTPQPRPSTSSGLQITGDSMDWCEWNHGQSTGNHGFAIKIISRFPKIGVPIQIIQVMDDHFGNNMSTQSKRVITDAAVGRKGGGASSLKGAPSLASQEPWWRLSRGEAQWESTHRTRGYLGFTMVWLWRIFADIQYLVVDLLKLTDT